MPHASVAHGKGRGDFIDFRGPSHGVTSPTSRFRTYAATRRICMQAVSVVI
ncbi:hypothetical protein BIFGAL_03271 [Bifidobacterium gallicum DSM 20093 = LMG 11596]|uniref:Uncharacterized protein n=1 Tax=Bifidobacterium gallicum DSM 20093 = LMG 11596 TaxID=561180 RepID=D1NTV1_9BIFI|nr:hypothetical protein BIFGAL_03271 [Bifidobacterium gallicum DSM 20093 = LMG 11596]